MDNGRSAVVGVFEDQDRARQAVEDLRASGFSDDQIGYAMRGGEGGETTTTVTEDRDAGDAAGGALGGAVTGGILGTILGAAAALLIPGVGPVIAGGILGAALTGAAVGAAAGGLIGALTSMGVPEEEARYYQGEFEAGRTIVTVQAGDRQQEAIAILRRNGAYDATTQGGGTADYDTTGAAGYATTTTTSTTTGTTGAAGYAGYAGETRTAGEGQQVIELREEEVVPVKQAVQAGEVEVRKVVHEEQREIPVNVAREEVRIERHAVDRPLSGDVGDMQDEVVRVPVYEEQVELQRQGRVAEEVVIGKEVQQERQTVTGTVRREDVEVVDDTDVRVRGDVRTDVDVDVSDTTRR